MNSMKKINAYMQLLLLSVVLLSISCTGDFENMNRNPNELKAEGKNPFILDSKPATADYKEFISSETRYSRLKLSFPERAQELFDKAEKRAAERYEELEKRAKGME